MIRPNDSSHFEGPAGKLPPRLGVGEFLGRRTRARSVGHLHVTEYVYGASEELRRHSHERAYLNFVMEGGYAETYEGRERECAPGSVLVHPEGESHSEVMGESCTRILSVEFDPSWLSSVREAAPTVAQPALIRRPECTRAAARLYEEFRCTDDVSQLAIEALTLEILALSCRDAGGGSPSRVPAWLARARDVLGDRFVERPSLSAVASEVGVHPLHLARAFRKHFGCTVGGHLRRLRVERACHKLRHSDETLPSIALSCGFADQSHLTRTFKRLLGVTPARFRASVRPS